MKGARSPVPRLDKLPTILNQEASRNSVESMGAAHSVGSFSSVGPAHSLGSFSSASDAGPHCEAVPGAKVKHDSVAERLVRTSLTQTYHHGKFVGPSLALTPLSAILLSSNHGSHGTSKKGSTHSGRLKSLLKERAASRGVSRLGLVEDPSRRASPEPQVIGSHSFGPSEERSEGGPASPPPWAESPPPASPEVSTASLPGAGLLSAGVPLVTEEDIQRALRYFAGERGESPLFSFEASPSLYVYMVNGDSDAANMIAHILVCKRDVSVEHGHVLSTSFSKPASVFKQTCLF